MELLLLPVYLVSSNWLNALSLRRSSRFSFAPRYTDICGTYIHLNLDHS